MTIVYILLAFFLGAVIAFFLTKGKDAPNQLVGDNELLKSQLSEANNKIATIESDSLKKIEEEKEKYESILKEANALTAKLDKQLQSALQGKIDESLKEQLEETSKLRKKIKELEDEIEETEDDLSDAKKKLKKRDDEITNLQDNLLKEQKDARLLREDLEKSKQLLEDKTKELNLKIGSIDFVQEILSAPESKNTDIKKVDDNIAVMKSFALGQLMDCFAALKDRHISFAEGNFELYKSHWEQRFYEWASVTKKNWIDHKTTIAFVGEFSAGKTSIVNRILSQDDPTVPQLPVSTKATTAIATYIAGGSETSYTFVTPDDKRKMISPKTFTEKVSKEILEQVKGISSLIKYFVMTYKNPHLEGMSILDTPGFNSNDENDAERTMEVINECDALFWVFDINTGTVNRSSIKIIKEHLNKPLYVVINKVDLKAASDVKKVEDLIKKTLNDEGLKIESFIRFSAKENLDAIMTPIKSVKHLTEREQYINDLGAEIDNILSILKEEKNIQDKEYKASESKGNKVDDKFIQKMRDLYERCNVAVSIPHFEEHLFRKDNYEMSQEEFSRLQNVLENVCSDVENMARIYDEKTDSAYTVQQNWTNVCEAKTAWQRVNELSEQFRKITTHFN